MLRRKLCTEISCCSLIDRFIVVIDHAKLVVYGGFVSFHS